MPKTMTLSQVMKQLEDQGNEKVRQRYETKSACVHVRPPERYRHASSREIKHRDHDAAASRWRNALLELLE